ncbi:MAG TPA: hypothetical protein ENI80_08400 [Acidiferrobacteraceae bacterium]|nr:hypothetical protein [Acidiferrobacteraceae bacterium]
MKTQFSKKDINRLFALLNEELISDDVHGELYVVGGAVMCLVYNARASTRDIDSLFIPAAKIRQAAQRVSAKANIKENWLNDSVKSFLSEKTSFSIFLELSHLKIMCAQAEYLLAMKCLAMRIGEEFFDLDDIRYLIRYLNISAYDQAIDIISEYYPIHQFPQKTLYAIEEILS